jgi:autotransporter-associated beta strand protein
MKRILLAVCIVLISGHWNLFSADVLHTYTGADGGDFTLGSNWDLATAPNATNHTITFNTANSNDPVLTGSATIKSMTNPVDALSETRQITGGGTLTFQADTGNATISNLDNNNIQFYVDVDVQSDTDINLTGSSINFSRALKGNSARTINVFGPASGNSSINLQPTFNGDNNTFTGVIKLNGRARIELGDSSAITTPTVQSTGLTIKMATTNSFNNLVLKDKTQTTYDFRLDVLDNDTSKIQFIIDSAAGASAYTYSGSMYSRDSGDTTTQGINRSIMFQTNGKTLTLNGDNSNFSFATGGQTLQFENNNATTGTVYIDSASALGTSNGNKMQINNGTGALNFFVLNNRNITGTIAFQGGSDGVTNVIGGSDSGSASGSTSYSSLIKLNSNSDGANTRNLSLWANNTETVTFSGVISDNLASNYTDITKTGTGTVVLSGDNTYGGSTTVSAGTLAINNSSGSGTGTGSIIVSSGAYLYGTGTSSGTISSFAGTISPGSGANTVESLTLGGGAGTNLAGGTYVWDISNLANGEVTGYDVLEFTTAYDLSNLNGTPLNLQIHNINSYIGPTGGVAGNTYKFMQNVTNFNQNYFNLSDNMINTVWSITESGGSLFLSYQVVPEPGTWMLIGFTSLLLVRVMGRVIMKSRKSGCVVESNV